MNGTSGNHQGTNLATMGRKESGDGSGDPSGRKKDYHATELTGTNF
jgi:hypothetical protein